MYDDMMAALRKESVIETVLTIVPDFIVPHKLQSQGITVVLSLFLSRTTLYHHLMQNNSLQSFKRNANISDFEDSDHVDFNVIYFNVL